jgi:hypothetical protein
VKNRPEILIETTNEYHVNEKPKRQKTLGWKEQLNNVKEWPYK